MTPFDAALKLTLGFEGGLANVKGDRGGLTNYGITQRAYNTYRARKGLPPRSVESIAQDEVRSLYREDYWLLAHCPELPGSLAQVVFDAAVHHGPTRALILLQEALGVEPAVGYFGNLTRAAIAGADEIDTIGRYLDMRQDFLDGIVEDDPAQVKFQRGWNNRIAALRDEFTHERNA